MKQQLEPILDALAHSAPSGMPDGGLMEGVWERVGAANSRRERTIRSALFAGLFAVGLGVGTVSVQPTVYARDASYPLLNDAGLSPATLLHVDP